MRRESAFILFLSHQEGNKVDSRERNGKYILAWRRQGGDKPLPYDSCEVRILVLRLRLPLELCNLEFSAGLTWPA